MTLVPSFLDLLQPLSFVMTVPTFDTLLTVLCGWTFAHRRTVTGIIVAADAVGHKHHSAYHRLFSTARWSLDELGLAVFGLILPLLSGTILLALDDTLARKRGLKICGVGMHHDPLLSTRRTTITNWGHCWVTLGVLLQLPCCGDRWLCLPILFRLYVPKKTAAKKKQAYQTKPQLAVQMLQVLCKRHENRRFHAVADSAYGGQSVLGKLEANCDLTSRLVMNARLYDAPKPRPGKSGRPRKRGQRLATPTQMLEGRCQKLKLDLYGRRDSSKVATAVARCYAVPQRELKVIAVDPQSGGREPQAFYSTCPADSARQVLERYACRWAIEVAYHDTKGQLGFEQPQNWTCQAVRRTAPMAMLLYSLVILWFDKEGHRHYQPPRWPWYPGKTRASFAEMLATLRCQSIKERVSAMGLEGQGSRNTVNLLLHMARLAA